MPADYLLPDQVHRVNSNERPTSLSRSSSATSSFRKGPIKPLPVNQRSNLGPKPPLPALNSNIFEDAFSHEVILPARVRAISPTSMRLLPWE